MGKYFRIFIYMLLLSFTLVAINNAFILTKAMAIYLYIFYSIETIGDYVIFAMISYFPIIFINGFVIAGLKKMLEVDKPKITFSLYIVLFNAIDYLYVMMIHSARPITQALILLGVNLLSLLALLFIPKDYKDEQIGFEESNTNSEAASVDEKKIEKTEEISSEQNS
ncbi:hypothetical protein JXR93_07320 [bacterium]|nr:hypothetical protein [bacterium]